ncbi:MAG: co-chaperone GroES family protein [Bacteroidales bacterium]|nr:co-chaperone GroES family protein [Bacteroidales bacterium]
MTPNNNKMQKVHIIGDRALIKPTKEEKITKSGLFLPPGYKEKEEVQRGYIIKTGPGYPIPNINDDTDNLWKQSDNMQRYMPLQVQESDLALFLQRNSVEIIYDDERYFIVNQHNILLVERDLDV